MNSKIKVAKISGRTTITVDGYRFAIIDWNDAALFGVEVGEIVMSKDADGQWQAQRRTADGLWGIDGDPAALEAFASAVTIADGLAAVDAHYEAVATDPFAFRRYVDDALEAERDMDATHAAASGRWGY